MVALAADTEQKRLRNWLAIWLLALLVHAAFFLTRVQWYSDSPRPKRVEIESIDTRRLEQIRNQWRSRELLISKNPNEIKSDTAPPKDARYESDRNRTVEKQQRAKLTQTLPKTGTAATPQAKSNSTPPPQTSPSRPRVSVPKLQNMGIPFRLSAQAPKPLSASAPTQAPAPGSSGQEAGDQYVREKLPEGSENLLNTQESVYYSFYSRIYNSIGPIWQSRTREITYRRYLRPGEYSTVVDIVLDFEGELLEIRHLQDSGIPELDHAVDSSWHRINRFPNPPRRLLNERGELHMVWTFTVHIDEGAAVQYLPPERLE